MTQTTALPMIAFLLISSTALSPALAQSTDVTQLETKIERLERVVDSMIKIQESQPTLSLKPGIRVVSADKAYGFGIDGFVQADAGWMKGATSDLPNSTTIKRARLGVKGTIDRDWHYRILTDFGNDDFQLMDANVSYKGIKGTTLTAGQFKEPFSLEQLTAAKYWTFNEKASMAALTPKRSLGIGATYHYGDGVISGGLFGENVNKNRADDEGYGVTGRATYVPIDEDGSTIHLGFSATHRAVDAESSAIRFKNGGENTLTSAFVDTGKMTNANSVTSFNPEVAVIYDAFSAQAEYIHTQVARDGASDLGFSGYYGEASYFLTGESRNYNKKKGVFGKVSPDAKFNLDNGDWGAWQLAYRYSHIDLNDADITGGTMSNHTVGLNWYPNDYARVSANVIQTSTDRHATMPNEDATIFMLRTQFEF